MQNVKEAFLVRVGRQVLLAIIGIRAQISLYYVALADRAEPLMAVRILNMPV